MAVLQGNAKQGSTRGFYPKTIEGSLRFNDDDTAYLSWTPASAGNRKTWTWSGWVKLGGAISGNTALFVGGSSGSNFCSIALDGNSNISLFWYVSSSVVANVTTSAKLRDPSAWYHLQIAVDTTQATASNRMIVYLNGIQQTSFVSTTYPSQNYDGLINNTNAHYLGQFASAGYNYLDGYLAEVFFIDGTAHNADAFGETKNGVWVPKNITATDFTMGTNGFYLNFQDDTAVEAFNTVLYRGTQSKQSITGYGFSPDLVWIKNRSSAVNHYLLDQVRGATKALFSNSTAAEDTDPQSLQSFDSDGFTLGNSYGFNASGDSYVAWGWKAGDSNVSNTDGSVTSTVRANQTYGFSIVSYTANNTNNATVGHGLGAVPDFVLVTARNFPTATNWAVWHSSLGSIEYYLRLNTTDAVVTTDNTNFGTVDPTSTVMNLGYAGSTNSSTYNYIMYCWTEKAGYSKFSSYEGTGNPNLSVTGLGFAPAWIMIKNIDDTGGAQWMIYDNTRDTTNPISAYLQAESTNTESAIGTNEISFDSDGFTVNSTTDRLNRNGDTMIYAAFADTREAAFWLDQSGNDNDWQPVNLDHNDTLLDSPTDNFCTWNPLNKGTNLVTSDGNLSFNNSTTETNHRTCVATHGMTSGKYYWEVQVDSTTNVDMIGIVGQNANLQTHVGGSGFGYGYSTANGNWYKASGWADDGTTPPAFPSGGTIGIAFDADNKKIYFHRDGQWINNANPTAGTGANGTYTGSETVFFPAGSRYYNTGKWTANFGQQPFKYDPPA